ncbi:hypothetical protein UGMREWDR_CDS0187 [Aeromonas phage GomatiRiver_11]|nr:hypothetical protein OBDJBBDK_00176 [Aeromonas phage AhFM11]WKW84354.1 hypothetical protein UGMREWDR_CDS0187 [Aeromonas phage GomatiRiver_11]
MPIVTESFFNYKSFFIDRLNAAIANSPDGCNRERCNERSTFLREYRTIHLNLGRMTGKTTGLLQLANEFAVAGYKTRLITMNPANKRYVADMVSYPWRDSIKISVMSDLDYRNPELDKVDFVMVDESEYTLTSKRHRDDLFAWAAKNGAKAVIMT